MSDQEETVSKRRGRPVRSGAKPSDAMPTKSSTKTSARSKKIANEENIAAVDGTPKSPIVVQRNMRTENSKEIPVEPIDGKQKENDKERISRKRIASKDIATSRDTASDALISPKKTTKSKAKTDKKEASNNDTAKTSKEVATNEELPKTGTKGTTKKETVKKESIKIKISKKETSKTKEPLEEVTDNISADKSTKETSLNAKISEDLVLSKIDSIKSLDKNHDSGKESDHEGVADVVEMDAETEQVPARRGRGRPKASAVSKPTTDVKPRARRVKQ